ncbi:MAG: glutamine phosphoribosylpyrophosphate amidotransferase [Acidobacteriota bacterium]|nr:glutamine phosphoribosylpyrophosphate amidotransferase [Acidobacteriota bacterium]
MCGIVGYLNRSGSGAGAPIGSILLGMLKSLDCRGPDSAGVAIFGPTRTPNLKLRIKLNGDANLADSADRVRGIVSERVPVLESATVQEYLQLLVGPVQDAESLLPPLEKDLDDFELVSGGRQLEIVKQVGSPTHLDTGYGISMLTGTHGIGHTRLSTESRVDLSHSQPFGVHGVADLATVHNGHITNYHKLRGRYEQMGVRFFTENDSEVIGVYLAHQMSLGRTFREALESSLDDFDGSFSYLAASGNELAYAKDRFGFKPLLVAESEDWVAIATEEIALRSTLAGDFDALEPGVRRVRIWSLPEPAAEKV